MASLSETWLDRPALQWSSEEGGPYWEESELFRTAATEESSLSFFQLAILAASLANNIRQCLSDCSSSQCSVAVAIPEGVYLPITITAVHALNSPAATNSGTPSVILVPLDPTDASKRLQHMIDCIQPALILTVSDCDEQRINEVITQSATARKPLVTNLRGFLLQSMTMLQDRSARTRIEAISNKEHTLLDWIQSCEYELYKVESRTRASDENRISHVVFTSGTTGVPKGCVSSIQSLQNYLFAKNQVHSVSALSRVLLGSSISFDPCLSDILATFTARATLVIASRSRLISDLSSILESNQVTHCLCTPTLWSTLLVQSYRPSRSLVVALGGEPIPRRVVQAWARTLSMANEEVEDETPRLLATYGVTEACVYQTAGEVFRDEPLGETGQDVGHVFKGMHARVCQEDEQNKLLDVPEGCLGEVVLYGNQLDEYSAYWGRPELSCEKFIFEKCTMYYRTGDRGRIHPQTKRLWICGRIQGEDSMVKVNGVRVELGEIEAAIMDDNSESDFPVVVDCIVSATRDESDEKGTMTARDLKAYVVLSYECLSELQVHKIPDTGILCSEGPLLALLRERCKTKARVVPSTFVIIARIPLSPTGKRDRSGVPRLESVVTFASLGGAQTYTAVSATPLREYGHMGHPLADEIIECLNLLPAQEALLTTSATFAMLGGDSLAATRVVRALYAMHHGVNNSRFLGGQFGALDGPFAVYHLLSSSNLGEYVDWLDSNGVCSAKHERSQAALADNPTSTDNKSLPPNTSPNDKLLHVALVESVSKGYTQIACGLLQVGADPNHGAHTGRLGKTKGRLLRKTTFRSSVLHIASLKGNSVLVRELLRHDASPSSPDASGLFPIHLVASGETSSLTKKEDDLQRLECMKLLLSRGVPLQIKDGNKQTVLHAAARAGHSELLQYLLCKWHDELINVDPRKRESLDWRDRWGRTAVHWAVLNNRPSALQVLLKHGCSPDPIKPKVLKSSSVAIESPMEMCNRIYGESEAGKKLRQMLVDCANDDQS